MRTQFSAELERPVPAAHVGRGGLDKPTVKRGRVGRESEGFVVPTTPVENGRVLTVY